MVQEFHLSITPVRLDEYLVRVEWMEPGVPLAEEHVSWPVDDWLAKAKQVFTEPLAALINRDSRPTGLAQIAQGRLPGTGQRDGGLESGGLGDGDDNAGNDYAPGSDYQIITFNPLNSETLSAASQGGLNAASEPSLVQLGQELYDALFQGTIRDSWVMAQGVAQNHERPLRLRLGMKGDRLPRLPWEVLHAANRPLAAATDIVFSRYHSGHSTIAPAQFHSQFHNQAEASLPGALRILMVLSAPDDQANLELKQEALQLQQELEQQRSGDRPNQQPQIELTLLEQPGREALTQKLEQAQYQVFHFAGHSSPGPAGGKLELVNATTGLTESLNGDDLAGLLVNNGIKLAVFNSCLSTQAATSDEFDLRGERTLAEALIHRGIPSVLAMAERIPDQVALTLSRLFYRNIRLGHPLDVSLCRARQGLISSYGSNQLYWALPILYLQTHFEGRLVRSWSDAQGAIAPSSSPGGPPGYQPESPSQGLGQGRRGERSPGPLGNAGVAQLWTEEAPGPGAGAGSGTTASQGSWVPTLDDRAPSPLPLASPAVADSALALPGSRTSAELVAGAPDRGGAIASPPSSVPGSAVPASGSAPPMTSARPGQPRRSWRSIWLGLGAIAAVGIVGGTGWGIARWVAPTPGVEVVDETPLSPRDYAETTALVDDGVSAFRRNEPAAAAAIAQTLLDNNALEGAEVVLGVPTPEQLTPEINFLLGRLNWQKQFSAPLAAGTFDDAYRYWSFALKAEPENWKYLTALGFAAYAKGDLTSAQDHWETVSNKLRQAESGSPGRELLLNAKAGLALIAQTRALQEAPGEQSALLKTAIDGYRLIQAEAPQTLQPELLGRNTAQNWFWNQALIEQWLTLSRRSAGGAE